MSAFIVSDKCITNVLHGVRKMAENGRLPDRKIAGVPVGLYQSESETLIGRAFLELNQEAVRQRYGAIDAIPRYEFPRGVSCSLIQSFKSAQCLRYQCSEGNVPETELYKQLEALIAVMAESIVQELPEYDQANWG